MKFIAIAMNKAIVRPDCPPISAPITRSSPVNIPKNKTVFIWFIISCFFNYELFIKFMIEMLKRVRNRI